MEPRSAVSQQKFRRVPSSSQQSVVDDTGVQTRVLRRPQGKIFSEYQDNFKTCPVKAVHIRKPTDCIRLQGKMDMQTNYADAYKGVKGKAAKLTRHPITVGSEARPIKTFSEYQDTFKTWKVSPERSLKPTEYRPPGRLSFDTSYAQDYKLKKIQKRPPIIHLQQTAMPTGRIESITSYRNDFTGKPAKYPPSSGRPKVGETQHHLKRRQLSCATSANERPQPPAPAHHNRGKLPIIQLQQTAMPTGSLESITSYDYDFTGQPDKCPPSSGRPTGGETQHLLKRRQLSRATPTKERPQPPAPAHHDRGRLPIIQLQQTAMPTGSLESITSYDYDKCTPSSGRLTGGETQHLLKRRQLSRATPTKERPQPPAPAHHDRGRLPIIQLQQTAMPTESLESITSYDYDFTGQPDKYPPSSGRPTGGETQHLLKRRQLSCATSTNKRPQPPAPAHHDRGRLPIIQLQQTAMPTGSLESITSYDYDKCPPSSGRLTGGETQHLLKRRQLSCATSTNKRPQPPAPAHHDRGRLPIIQLQQTAMPTESLESITSYDYDFTGQPDKYPPSSGRPTGGETQHLLKRRQLSCATSANERPQPPAPAHHDRGRLPIIQLQQTAMPTESLESITSYDYDFTGQPDKYPPSSGRPTGGETQHLLKRRQLSCATSANKRPQPPAPAHHDRGRLPIRHGARHTLITRCA